jgi:hypothetical protein
VPGPEGRRPQISSYQVPFTLFWDKNKSVSQKNKSVFRVFHRFSRNLRRRILNRHQAYLGLFGGGIGKGDVGQHVGKIGGKKQGLCLIKGVSGTKKDRSLTRRYYDVPAHTSTPETQMCRVLMEYLPDLFISGSVYPFLGQKQVSFVKNQVSFPDFSLFFPEFTPENPEPAPSVFRLVWREDREGRCGLVGKTGGKR